MQVHSALRRSAQHNPTWLHRMHDLSVPVTAERLRLVACCRP